MITLLALGIAIVGLAIILSALLVTPVVLLWEWWQRRQARRSLASQPRPR